MAGIIKYRNALISIRSASIVSFRKMKGGVYLSKVNDRGSIPSSSSLSMAAATETAFLFTFIFRTIAPNEVNYIFLQG